MVAPCDRQHIRHELRGDGRAGHVLLVHPRIREAGNNGGNSARRRSLAGRDEDEEFHEVVVGVAAPRLDDEHVFVSDGLGNFDIYFAIGELLDGDRDKRDVEPMVCA